MSTIKFLQSVLGDQGKYCLFAGRREGKVLRGQRNQFFDDLDELIASGNEACRQGYETYFALGTFDAEGTREAMHVIHMRAFFLDLDCGEGKDFPNQVTAVSALRRFCSKFQLPKPTMVNSGRGVHVYWGLKSPVGLDRWKPQADRFKQLCIDYGLKIDRSVPADAARVLRLPGTLNYKDNPPTRVRVLGELSAPVAFEDFVDTLNRHTDEATVPKVSNNAFKDDPLMQALLGNVGSRFKLILEKTNKGKGCAQIKHCTLNQSAVDEPLWRAVLSVAAHCEDKDKAIHVVSKHHPEYDPRETERKAAQTKGPYHCVSFNALNPGLCEGCPHFGKLTSPIQLGRSIKRAEEEDNIIVDKYTDHPLGELQEYVIPKYPFPYFRGKSGGVYMEVEGAEEKSEVMVYQHDLYVTKRIVDPDESVGECALFRLHLPHDGLREFVVPLASVTSPDELRKNLSRYGVAVQDVRQIMTYTLRWVDTLARQKKADVSRKQFGWIDEDMSAFALGNMLIWADDIENNPPSSRTAPHFKTFEPKGSLEGWKKTINFFNKPGFEEQQYVIGTSFGAVLGKLTPVNGSLLHYHSKGSGHGKTTTLYACASVWGNPKTFVRDAKDTVASRMLFAEIWKDLPVYVDELTNIEPKAASDFVYQVTSGMQRDRMVGSANASRWRGEAWSTIFVTTANTSIVSIVASAKDSPQAEAQRIVEIEALKKLDDKAKGDKLAQDVLKDYGHAGPIFVQYVIRNKAAVAELLEKVQAKIDREVGLTSQNRFWSAQAALVITGLHIAKHLKLVQFDMKGLVAWVINFLRDYKLEDAQMVSPSSALEVVAEYYFDNVNNFLRIRSTLSAGDDAESTGLDHLITPDATPRVHLLGRHETDTNTLFLLPKPFKKWCTEKQIDYGAVVRDLRTGPAKGRAIVKRLGTGTKLNLPPVNTIRLYGSGWLTEDHEQKTNDTEAVDAPQD